MNPNATLILKIMFRRLRSEKDSDFERTYTLGVLHGLFAVGAINHKQHERICQRIWEISDEVAYGKKKKAGCDSPSQASSKETIQANYNENGGVKQTCQS